MTFHFLLKDRLADRPGQHILELSSFPVQRPDVCGDMFRMFEGAHEIVLNLLYRAGPLESLSVPQ